MTPIWFVVESVITFLVGLVGANIGLYLHKKHDDKVQQEKEWLRIFNKGTLVSHLPITKEVSIDDSIKDVETHYPLDYQDAERLKGFGTYKQIEVEWPIEAVETYWMHLLDHPEVKKLGYEPIAYLETIVLRFITSYDDDIYKSQIFPVMGTTYNDHHPCFRIWLPKDTAIDGKMLWVGIAKDRHKVAGIYIPLKFQHES